jgi:hypothetical protein
MTDLVMNDDTARPESFTVLGREIKVAPLNTLSEGQVLGFMKIFTRYLHGEVDGQTMVKLDQALGKLLDAADNNWLDYQVMEDKIAWTDVLMGIAPCLRTDKEPAKVAAVKAASRARKAAKKAPAKKVAAKKATKGA